MISNFKNLDYAAIKDALKEFLRTQKDFQDFDFDTSGIQQILSLLAYNTQYNQFYLNMVASEMFLDSAQLRASIVSRAKNVGYTPSSASAAKAKVRIEVDTLSGPLPANPSFVTLSPNDEFQCYLEGKAYTFTPDRTYLIERNAQGAYVADVILVEGKRLTFRTVVDATSPVKQRFQIPNKMADLSSLVVKVQESQASSAIKIYSRAQNANQLASDSLVYFIQENESGNYEIYFGENVLGVQPITGNVVICEYLVTNGPIANGMKSFARIGKPTGYNVLKLTTLSPAKDGADPESNESIRLLAPLLYQAQDRAVVKSDYEALIRKDNPSVEFVRVWGGEENSPPDFGKVYVAIKPRTGTRLSIDEKNSIANRLLRERNVVSVEVKIVDPDYLYMKTNTKVSFRSKRTVLKGNDLKKLVYDKIVSYKTANLNGFDADFTYSKLVAAIDEVDQSIIGNATTIELKKRIYPAFNSPSRFELNFFNAIGRGDAANDKSAINSSGYIYRGVTTYIGDDGKGELYLYRIVDNKKVIIQRGAGTVNYDAGVVVVQSLDVQNIEGQDFIELIVTPAEYDVFTPRESILLLENQDIKVFVDAIDISGEVI